MLEKYLEQDKSLQRLSQEVKNVQKGLVGMHKDQQDQFERFRQQAELQRVANEKASTLESHMTTLASHVVDLRKEMDDNAQASSSHQKEMSDAMTSLTQELRQLRLNPKQVGTGFAATATPNIHLLSTF